MIRIFGLLLLLSVGGFAQNPLTATFPTTLDTEMVFCNQSRAILTAPMTNSTSDLTITLSVGTISKFCAPSWVTVDAEVMKVCTKGASTLTVCSGGRAVHGGIASHATGAAVVTYWDENYSNYLYAIMKSIQNALGVSFGNIVTRSRDFQFNGDGLYDIGDNSGIGRPRDVRIFRDLYVDHEANIGAWKIGNVIQTASTSITLDWATHNGYTIATTSASPVSITIPNGLGVFSVLVIQEGTGQITFVQGGGVSMFNPDSTFKSKGQGALMTVTCWTTNKCSVGGNLQQ